MGDDGATLTSTRGRGMPKRLQRGVFRNTRVGRVGTVMRAPRPGREVTALGGLKRFKGRDVVDIGTGDGRLAFDLASCARTVLGVDPSPEAIAAASDRAKELGLRNMRFAVGDARTLDVGRERWDVAIFSWSL